MTKSRSNSQTSNTHAINLKLKSVPLEQEITAIKTQLKVDQKDFKDFDEKQQNEGKTEDNNDDLIKRYIKYADLSIKKKDYESAREYLSKAKVLADSNPYYKYPISTRLLLVEEHIFFPENNQNKQPPDDHKACCKVMWVCPS